MALNFFVLLTILHLALSVPEPNVKLGVDVKIEDKGNNCCGGRGEDISRGCLFGGVVYKHKTYLTDTFYELQCMDGTLTYTGNFDNTYGNCTFGGEPYIYMFDTLDGYTPISTTTNLIGEYIMTQPGLSSPAEFGVNSHFTDTNVNGYTCQAHTDCINGITYYQNGFEVSIFLTYNALPIQVLANGFPCTVGSSVKILNGGAILVFSQDNLYGQINKCITVIGSYGLTVTFCASSKAYKYPWAYIYAVPSLKSSPSQLYGLCNTWTGGNQDCFTIGDGNCTGNWQCGISPYHGYPVLCNSVAETWEVGTLTKEETDMTTTTSSTTT